MTPLLRTPFTHHTPQVVSPKPSWCFSVVATAIAIAAVTLLSSSAAFAQARPAQRRASTSQKQPLMFRGFADLGSTTFTASDSFKAILGSSSGLVFGGGGEIVLPMNVFVGVRASRFRGTGDRVFISDGERFDLGINTTVTVRPLEITGGYRFVTPRARIIPYAGGGIGWHRYEETSDFSADTDNVDETFRGYHVLGGAEVRITRWIGAAGEAQWTTVPNALGANSSGVSSTFSETNLGGATFRAKVVIGH
jgi:opacity protein-like surface antigen